MKKVAVFLFSILAAAAQAQTAVYREGSTYTDRPSPEARRVTLVLNIVDSYPVSLVHRPTLAGTVPPPATPPAPQVVINIAVRQPSPYNYGGQRPHFHHYPRSHR